MSLSDQSRNQMRRDDAPLRVGSKEDGVGSTKLVDPGKIGEVGFEEPAAR